MIIDVNETKRFLKVDYDDEDALIESLCTSAGIYLYNATGKRFSSENELAVLYCKTLVSEWYNNRNLMERKDLSDKVRFTLKGILLQLQYCESE